MILTDYYRFDRIASKAKSRLDCTFSTHSYTEFEQRATRIATKKTEKRDAIKVGDILIYYNSVPFQFKGNAQRKADKSLSIQGKNLSSVYIPDVTKPLGYGDFKGTTDALLFIFTDLVTINGVIQGGGTIEIFIARGKNRDCIPLYNMLADGELDEEINKLRNIATKIR